jgi:hypothetical protein
MPKAVENSARAFIKALTGSLKDITRKAMHDVTKEEYGPYRYKDKIIGTPSKSNFNLGKIGNGIFIFASQNVKSSTITNAPSIAVPVITRIRILNHLKKQFITNKYTFLFNIFP